MYAGQHLILHYFIHLDGDDYHKNNGTSAEIDFVIVVRFILIVFWPNAIFNWSFVSPLIRARYAKSA